MQKGCLRPVAFRTRNGLQRGDKRLEDYNYSVGRAQLLHKGSQSLAILIESDNEEHSNKGDETDNMIELEVSQSQSSCQSNYEGQYEVENGQKLKKGRFTPQEQKAITDAVGQFLAVHNIAYDDFLVILNEQNIINTILKNADFFKSISKAVPGRSVRTIRRFMKRCFSRGVLKGRWSPQDQQILTKLVKEKGKEWKQIGRLMGRSADSVYDKYKQLGKGKQHARKQHIWQFRQFIELLVLVDRKVETKFLDLSIKEEKENERYQNAQQGLALMRSKYNSVKKLHHFFELAKKYVSPAIRSINFEGIGWTEISHKLKGRTMIDCKNKFMQLFQLLVKSFKYDDMKIAHFIEGQYVEGQTQIMWKHWSHTEISWQEAKNRFMVLKKKVPCRGCRNFTDFIAELKRRLTLSKGEQH